MPCSYRVLGARPRRQADPIPVTSIAPHCFRSTRTGMRRGPLGSCSRVTGRLSRQKTVKFCDVAAQDTGYPHSLLNRVVVQSLTTVGEEQVT
jgi:hypothetical protein